MALHQEPQLPSIMSRLQGPVQAFLRPAAWIPWYRNIRYHREKWGCNNKAIDVFARLCEIAREFSISRTLLDAYVVVHKEDSQYYALELHTYTPKAEWLDVVEIKVTAYRGSDGCSVDICSFSTGLVPTIIPGAPLFNLFLFWVPFSGRDSHGWVNSRRVFQIREHLAAKGISIAN